jgi:transcriptional regulator with XRE-family HTH domain
MPTNLHNHLRAHRKARGFTQEQVANILGIRNSTLSGWETGSRILNLKDIENLAKVYDLHPAALLMPPAESERVELMRQASDVAGRLDSEAGAEWVRLGQRLADAAKEK